MPKKKSTDALNSVEISSEGIAAAKPKVSRSRKTAAQDAKPTGTTATRRVAKRSNPATTGIAAESGDQLNSALQAVVSAGSGSAAAVALAPIPSVPARRKTSRSASTSKAVAAAATTIPEAPSTDQPDFYTEVERAAYFIAEGRGFQNGDPVADWFEAERIVRARLANLT